MTSRRTASADADLAGPAYSFYCVSYAHRLLVRSSLHVTLIGLTLAATMRP